MQVIDGSH
jgi:hypothetical protein